MSENAAAGPRSNWPTAFCVRYWLRKVVALPGPAAGQHERLGVDHEAVHEAQQHGDQQHAAQLGQLDVAEHRPGAGAVDARRLVVGVGDGAQAGVAEQRDQRRPVPDIHDQYGDPGVEGVRGVVVVDTEVVDGNTPSRPMSGRPKICQMVPTTFHGISSGSASSTRVADARRPLTGIDSARPMPSGISTTRTDSE